MPVAPPSRVRARIASVGIPSGSLRHWRSHRRRALRSHPPEWMLGIQARSRALLSDGPAADTPRTGRRAQPVRPAVGRAGRPGHRGRAQAAPLPRRAVRVFADRVPTDLQPGGHGFQSPWLQRAQLRLRAFAAAPCQLWDDICPAGLSPYRARRWWRRRQIPWSVTDRGAGGLRRILECRTDGLAGSGRWFTTT